MGEIREVRWSWLAGVDRKYNYHGRRISTPVTPASSGSRQLPSDSSPGHRPLPPSMWTARELFIADRRFRLLLSRRLTSPFQLVRHSRAHLFFQADYDREIRAPYPVPSRSLPWEEVERLLLEGRVRWLTSIPRRKWPSRFGPLGPPHE